MTTFAEEMQAVALSLLTEYGEAVTFARVVEGTYNTGTGTTASGTTSSFSGYGFMQNYSAFEIQQKDITQQDIRLLVNKTSSVPLVGDVVTAGAVAYRVMKVDKITANGQDIYYDLQVRI